jgi:DNA-binding transcriptional MocR family regulator
MQTNLAWETLLDLPATRPGPLHMRLAAAIRTAIRDGRIPREAALPPSRTLAADLGVSRWTVTQAYAQLVTEAYLTARTGSSPRVSCTPRPDLDETAGRPAQPPGAVPARPARFDLSSARPDLRAFPRRKWVEAIRAAAEIPVSPPALNQLALALFMESGAYDRHLRASRRRFRARRGALVGALQRRLPGYCVRGADAGLDLLLELPPGSDADAIVAGARRQDMWLCSLDDLRFQPEPSTPGLILGYGNLNDSLVDEAVAVLAGLISPAGRR